jgi:hypothetical protein
MLKMGRTKIICDEGKRNKWSRLKGEDLKANK